MKFCKICQLCMKREIRDNTVIYVCFCGNVQDGENEDLCINEEKFINTQTIEQYNNIIKNSAFDKTANLINKTCDKCNRDYMTHVIISENEISIYTCKCGNIVT